MEEDFDFGHGTETDEIRDEDLAQNPATRVPICLCLDTSGTMGIVEGGEITSTGQIIHEDGKTLRLVTGNNLRTRLKEMQKGIDLFFQSILNDNAAKYSADISVITFDSEARVVKEFSVIDEETEVPQLRSQGETAMGEGVNLALDLLESRKEMYRSFGRDYYQPWLVLMTDGEPDDNDKEREEVGRAEKRIRDMVANRKLTVFAIGIGKEANLEVLKRFSPSRAPLRLKGLNFSEFFEWLSQSVSRTSQSVPGEKVQLDTAGIQGWGEL